MTEPSHLRCLECIAGKSLGDNEASDILRLLVMSRLIDLIVE